MHFVIHPHYDRLLCVLSPDEERVIADTIALIVDDPHSTKATKDFVSSVQEFIQRQVETPQGIATSMTEKQYFVLRRIMSELRTVRKSPAASKVVNITDYKPDTRH